MNTIQQKYAASVYEKVNAYKNSGDKEDYGIIALNLPVLVHTAGLTQALAFLKSRGKDAYNALLDDLAEVIGEGDAQNLLNKSRTCELQDYVYLTKKTMLALEWFKRYAQSVLKVESTESAEV